MPIFTPSPLDPHIELDGEPDIGLDELLNILQEDPAAALEKYQAVSTSSKEMDVDGTTLALGPPSWHQEPEIAPHTPAVPEGHYGAMLAPSANEATQDRYWLHDLNAVEIRLNREKSIYFTVYMPKGHGYGDIVLATNNG